MEMHPLLPARLAHSILYSHVRLLHEKQTSITFMSLYNVFVSVSNATSIDLTNGMAKIKPNIVVITINMNKLKFSNKLDLMELTFLNAGNQITSRRYIYV